MKFLNRTFLFATWCLLIVIGEIVPAAGIVGDPTRGGQLIRQDAVEGRRVRWVGPIGAYCGVFWGHKEGEYLTQLLVQDIEKGSPADGVLKPGDIIIGADGTGAEKVPLLDAANRGMITMANAIGDAEARNPAILKLLVWQRAPKKQQDAPKTRQPSLDNLGGLDEVGGGDLGDWGPSPKKKAEAAKKKAAEALQVKGEVLSVSLKLQHLGRYSDTAPYNCEKSKRILRMGVKALYESDKPGTACLGALSLLAADDPTDPDNDKYQAKAKEWIYKMLADTEKNVGGPWQSGPRLIALAEYYMKTGDKAVFPELVRRAEHHAKGVSWVGTTGHRWADKRTDGSTGRISGYGAINCSGTLGFLGLTLARKAGVDSPVVLAANERQRIFFGHYYQKGRVIYGEYTYGINGATGDENGRHAMPALALGLHDGQEAKAKYFSRMTALATSGNRTYAHGGPYFGTVWQPVGAAVGGEKLTNFHFQEIRWHLELKRHWNGRRIFDPTSNSYGAFSEDATALLFYALPLKRLYVTGRDREKSLELSDAELAETVEAKTFDPPSMSTKALIDSLSRHEGMLRGPATAELAKRVQEANGSDESVAITQELISLASDKKASPVGRTGACRAFMDIKNKAKEPVATLMNAEITKACVGMLKEGDPYIRYGAARALTSLRPRDVRPYANDMLDVILAIDRPTFPLDEENPCRWDHGVIGQVLATKVLSEGTEGLDRKKLVAAFDSLLATPFSTARTSVAQAIKNLSLEETREIASTIAECMKEGAPVNAAGDGAASICQQILAKHRFEEALPLSMRYGAAQAAKNNIALQYGQAALKMDSARDIMKALGDLMLVEAIGGSDKVLEQMMSGKAPDNLNRLKVIHSAKAVAPSLTLPAAETELVVDATNYLVRDAKDTRYTWRKIYGAGEVSFAPNASPESKKTLVSFVDKKPGKYRFEVTMSDSFGFNEVTEIVDISLLDKRGKLPGNKPPETRSQTLKVIPGKAVRVTLTGRDPDGDDLGFVVTKQPEYGALSGSGGKLIYVANYGNPNRQKVVEKARKAAAPVKGPSLDDVGDFDPFGGPAIKKNKKDSGAKKVSLESWKDSLMFEVLDGQGLKASGTIEFIVSDQNVGVAIYEGFDYPTGTMISRTDGTSFGFDGPWQRSDGKPGGPGMKDFWVARGSLDDPSKSASLSYPGLPSTGGHYVRGAGHRTCSRLLNKKILNDNKLLENGEELWFSLFVATPEGKGAVKFGLEGHSRTPELGFEIKGYEVHSYLKDAVSKTARNPYTRSAGLRFDKDKPSMIIGRCVWGKTDKDLDTIAIYRVFDAPDFGPLVLNKPVATSRGYVDQTKIMKVNLNAHSPVDEIRVGRTLQSVMAGTKSLIAASR